MGIQELVQTCRNATKQSERYVQDVTDEAVLMGLLEANDCVCTSLMKYESVALAGPQSGGAQPAPEQPAAVQPAPEPFASTEDIDLSGLLGGGGMAPPSWASSNAQPAQPPPPQMQPQPMQPQMQAQPMQPQMQA